MGLKFVDGSWYEAFQEAFEHVSEEVLIVSPFIALSPVRFFLDNKRLSTKIITRFNLNDFYNGVSDIRALHWLINNGSQIKGIKNLHAKVYIFDCKQAIVASANFTDAAIHRNQEFGISTTKPSDVLELRKYFEQLWRKAGSILTEEQLEAWNQEIEHIYNSGGVSAKKRRFKDYGKNLGYTSTKSNEKISPAAASQYYIKFFGKSDDRAYRDWQILDLIRDSGCHWACTYPKEKRPRSVPEGAVMFMGYLVNEPNDILIYGRAMARRYIEGRDDASEQEIESRSWKRNWPHYIRVREAEFLSGNLGRGISMYKLMSKFNHNSFMSTQRHFSGQSGNIDPRRAYRRQAHVQLSRVAATWLNNEFERLSRQHGQISKASLRKLDWPDY